LSFTNRVIRPRAFRSFATNVTRKHDNRFSRRDGQPFHAEESKVSALRYTPVMTLNYGGHSRARSRDEFSIAVMVAEKSSDDRRLRALYLSRSRNGANSRHAAYNVDR